MSNPEPTPSADSAKSAVSSTQSDNTQSMRWQSLSKAKIGKPYTQDGDRRQQAQELRRLIHKLKAL
jgi:hypothetical protein